MNKKLPHAQAPIAGQTGSKGAKAIRDAGRTSGKGKQKFTDDLQLAAAVLSQMWNENIVDKMATLVGLLGDTPPPPPSTGVEKLPRMSELELPSIAQLTAWFEQLEQAEKQVNLLMAERMETPNRIRENCRSEIMRNQAITVKQMESLQQQQLGLIADKDKFLAGRKDAIRVLFEVQSKLGTATDSETKAEMRAVVLAYRKRERAADLEDDVVTRKIVANAAQLQIATDHMHRYRRSLEDMCRSEVDEFLGPIRMAGELLTEVRTTKDIVWREVEEAQLIALLAALDDDDDDDDDE